MSSRWGLAITAMAALATSCATEDKPTSLAPLAAPNTSMAAPTSDAAPSTASSAAEPVALAAACPLLSNDDLTRLLNNNKDAKLVPAEGTPRDTDGGKTYRCAYNRGSTTALELIAREFPADNGRTAATAIDAVAKTSKGKTTPLTGVGEAAVFYPIDNGGVILSAAKVSGGKVRLIALTGPKAALPQDKLTAVATMVMERL